METGEGIGGGMWKSASESTDIHVAIRSGNYIDPDLQREALGGSPRLAQEVGTDNGLVMNVTVTVGEAVRQMTIERPIIEDMMTTIESDN